jgi:hypothetical protein
MASLAVAPRAIFPQFPIWPGSHRGAKTPFECTTCELRTAECLCGLSNTAIEALQEIKLTAAYPAGTKIYMEGQPARGVLFFARGASSFRPPTAMIRDTVSRDAPISCAISW